MLKTDTETKINLKLDADSKPENDLVATKVGRGVVPSVVRESNDAQRSREGNGTGKTEVGFGGGSNTVKVENGAETIEIGDERMMRLAIREAQNAEAAGEVPVGAVLIAKDGAILAAAGNRKEREKNPLRHAETVAMDEGIRKYGKYLTDCTLYVTLEPCAMCAGAMVNARLGRLVFGAYDKKGGAAGTSMDVLGNPALNHAVSVTGGVLETECAEMLGAFFKRRREEKKCF